MFYDQNPDSTELMPTPFELIKHLAYDELTQRPLQMLVLHFKNTHELSVSTLVNVHFVDEVHHYTHDCPATFSDLACER